MAPRSAVSVGETAQRLRLLDRFADRIVVNPDLDRRLVSYQADKQEPGYRWLRYKEAFSSSFVRYVLTSLTKGKGYLLDPFAGSGSALFGSAEMDWSSVGIEISPVAVVAVRARLAAARVSRSAFDQALKCFLNDYPNAWRTKQALPHIPITRYAYPTENEEAIARYLAFCSRLDDPDVALLFRLAGLAVLEECSYTRKDGQFLRWDARSGKPRVSPKFRKGNIASFPQAVKSKLHQMRDDLFAQLLPQGGMPDIRIHEGSCLELLPTLGDASFDFVLTSPPYCNRYDYTRTYALELVYLGLDAQAVKQLRQKMLCCTVENRDKLAKLRAACFKAGSPDTVDLALRLCKDNAALRETLGALDEARRQGRLNNPRIYDMVQGYFFEMAFVICQLARVLRSGALAVIVNDNVRYAGVEVPVDIILSSIAEQVGFHTDHIWVLPVGKGNSSQQMRRHGRSELRKCVYVWRRL